MASISDDKLQELRDRVDLVAIVQRRVPLKKSGRDWKGLCPFHGEKTPSFYVVPDKKFWNCFGCGAQGDAIKFVMQLEAKSFREAIESLATEAGIDLTPADPEESRRASHRAALAEVNERAAKFYERVLWEHPRGAIAREHLQKRSITEETARAWRLGYAPGLWDALAKSLLRAKVDALLIEEAGLAVPRKKGQGLYDRFRGRLMIPIRESGRVVAFGGRLLEGESDAKYLNSPETPLYQKGSTLFGMDRARDALRRDGVALFVEGYFDAIGLHQAGVQMAVATCGTALTEKHLELVLKCGARELVFVFDGDAAGLRAAQRASEIAAAGGVTARVLVPPDGEDPDETVLRLGVEGFRELVSSAQPSIEFLLDRALAMLGKTPSIEERVRAVDSVAGIVKAAPTQLARALYVEKVAQRIGASSEVVQLALAGKAPAPHKNATALVRQAGQGTQAQQPHEGHPEALPSAAARTELVIVAHMLRSPELCAFVESSGAVSRFSMAGLRDLAERAFALGRTGNLLDIDDLLVATEPAWMRQRLLSAVREVREAGDTTEAERAHLKKLIAAHEKTLAIEQAARKQQKVPRVPRIRG